MLNFLIPKTKVRCYNFEEIPIENFEVIGIGQINPYYRGSFDSFNNEVFVTVINITEDNKNYDEKEGLVLSDYFTVRRCPKCSRIKLIPTKIRINLNDKVFSNEPNTGIFAYCNHCSSCYYFDIKENDIWLKETRKLKDKNLITKEWDKYFLE